MEEHSKGTTLFRLGSREVNALLGGPAGIIAVGLGHSGNLQLPRNGVRKLVPMKG